MYFPPPAVCSCSTRTRIVSRETDTRYWIKIGEWSAGEVPADITADLLDRKGCSRWVSALEDIDRRTSGGITAVWVGVPVSAVPSGDYDLQTVYPSHQAEDQEGMGGHCLKTVKVALSIV